VVTYAPEKRRTGGSIKAIFCDAPPQSEAATSKAVYFRLSRFRERLRAMKTIEGSLGGDVETQIRALYHELAALAEQLALGNRALSLRREIENKFSQLRSLQAHQANELTVRFRESIKLSQDDFRQLAEAERLLRERENPSGSDSTSE
jgi:hypothetical protein